MATAELLHAASVLIAGMGKSPIQSNAVGPVCTWCSNDSPIWPTNSAFMSFLGLRLGHFWKASMAASEKSSLALMPSILPNLLMPADTIEASGLPVISLSSPYEVKLML